MNEQSLPTKGDNLRTEMSENSPGWLIPKGYREVSLLTDLCVYSRLPLDGEGCATQSLGCWSSRRGQRELSDLLSCCEWNKGVFQGELSHERWLCTPPLVWHGHGKYIPRKTFWRQFPQASLPTCAQFLRGCMYFKRAERSGTTFSVLHKQSISVGIQSVFKVLRKRRFHNTPPPGKLFPDTVLCVWPKASTCVSHRPEPASLSLGNKALTCFRRKLFG